MPRAPLPDCACVRDEYGFVYMADCPRHGLLRPAPKGKGNPIVRGADLKRTPIKNKSTKGEARDNGWLRGIVYAQLVQQNQRRGWAAAGCHCEGCGKFISEDIVEALGELRPCHKTPRKEGEGVRFGSSGKVLSLGLDTYDNIYPGCDACNLRDHLQDRSDPAWSSDRADASQGQAAPPTEESA